MADGEVRRHDPRALVVRQHVPRPLLGHRVHDDVGLVAARTCRGVVLASGVCVPVEVRGSPSRSEVGVGPGRPCPEAGAGEADLEGAQAFEIIADRPEEQIRVGAHPHE